MIAFHDHGPWRGPCSTDRHRLLREGKAGESFGSAFIRLLTFTTAIVEFPPRCLCCKESL